MSSRNKYLMIIYSINKQVNTRMHVIWNKSDLGVGTVLQEFLLNLDAKTLSNYPESWNENSNLKSHKLLGSSTNLMEMTN